MTTETRKSEYLSRLNSELCENAVYGDLKDVPYLSSKLDFFNRAFTKMGIPAAKKEWEKNYNQETGKPNTTEPPRIDYNEIVREYVSRGNPVAIEFSKKNEREILKSNKRRRYLTFAMVVLLIGLIASFIVYYNDNDREAAFWVGVGLSALLFILLVYYFFM